MRTLPCGLAILLLAPATLLAAPVPAPIEEAVRAALTVPGAQLELGTYRPAPSSCEPIRAQVERPVASSGMVLVRFSGKECSGAAFVRATVRAQQWVAKHTVHEGEPIEAERAEREVRPGAGPLRDLPGGALASRTIHAGEVIEAASLRLTDPNAPVTIELRSGALRVDAVGHRVPCAQGHDCARLPSGKRVEGHFEDQRLIVELL